MTPGAEANLAPPCSNLRSFGSKYRLLYWRKHLWYCWDFRRPPQWFGAPIVIRRPGKWAPLPSSLRPCSAVRDSGVELHDTKGVTRSDGARGKAAPCLNLRSYGSKFTVLREVFVTLLEIFGVPAIIRRPHSDLAPARYSPAWSRAYARGVWG